MRTGGGQRSSRFASMKLIVCVAAGDAPAKLRRRPASEKGAMLTREIRRHTVPVSIPS